MHARAVDDAALRLRDLRYEEWEELGVAGLAMGLAVVATQVFPALAVPLLLGGLVVGARGVRALWRRWDLVDRLAADRDAHVISEVFAYASREATMERREQFAALIRSRLNEPGPPVEARIASAEEELQALASDLEDGRLVLDPACAVACMRLLSDPTESPLLNAELPADELRSRVCHIRAGFTSSRLAA